MQTAIAFILIFGMLVFFHELGHFLFAKRAGILVREFAIGMGPKIYGKTHGETMYTIRLLPIGGYVRMAGEDMDGTELQPGYRIGLIVNEDNIVKKIIFNQNNKQLPDLLFLEVERADLEKELFVEGYDEEERLVRYQVARDCVLVENGRELVIAPQDRQFNAKTVGQRAMTIFAGPLFNFILAFVIYLVIGLIHGVPTYEPIITEVVENDPAAQAGMLAGDRVTAINGQAVEKWQDLAAIVQDHPNEDIAVTVERNGQSVNLNMTVKEIQQDGEKYGQIGVRYESPREFNPLKAVVYGAQETYNMTVKIFELLGMLITGKFTIDALSGPVGIYKATEQVAQYGIMNLMNWAAMLSINLGIMNLLPLPALDGGRLLFFGFEALRGKPIDRQKEGIVHFVGIVLLMILMVVVTWNDIQRFFF
ncbi:RIP metalloprotease RseP [Lysinibacillus capsici]|uniref:RIP metalloprotease RseP n=1 Tax=Lysinibacillus TaxID=400634 RepID=UPI00065432B2|nr:MULTISPECIES: RIP metalloprotease RseP [Lysinibacillus]KMN40969.1 zinc metalloprotease [Lysinibacillus sp. LK3]MCT1541379.1 RIP metalloprotease RseP [Lysinibacillus capsici]MCT1572616.1 RIP metalloprotease RseP [Lysinibacillus capsici]MCT1649781.1 RIP metalloprotease RseP [Lysinibacillus capsici]MCT1728189.1 RIP metalloprotease RseP [Lysinibacillus capsici]